MLVRPTGPPILSGAMDLGTTAIGTWSGGRFMHFGEALDEARFADLVRPGHGIRTVLTADVYGEGEADRLLGRALEGLDRDCYSLVGAIGHDFHLGERQGAKGFPRFTDPTLRDPSHYAEYLRNAAERSLAAIGVSHFDVLLLHNPDRIGYTSPEVWAGMAAVRDAGLTREIGVAPGPANGFTLDLIGCLERFGDEIDWAMVILNPLEPWPGELVLDAAAAKDVKVLTRVVDYGGLFWGDLSPRTPIGEHDHRRFRPAGWIDAGLERIGRMDSIRAETGLTPMQLACQWNLAHPAVECVVPDVDPGGRSPCAPDRGQAPRARGASGRPATAPRPGRRDRGDRRQPRLDAAQGREPRARGSRRAGPLGPQR